MLEFDRKSTNFFATVDTDSVESGEFNVKDWRNTAFGGNRYTQILPLYRQGGHAPLEACHTSDPTHFARVR